MKRKSKYVIPEDEDPVELADRIKKGMSMRVLRDVERLKHKRSKARLALKHR